MENTGLHFRGSTEDHRHRQGAELDEDKTKQRSLGGQASLPAAPGLSQSREATAAVTSWPAHQQEKLTQVHSSTEPPRLPREPGSENGQEQKASRQEEVTKTQPRPTTHTHCPQHAGNMARDSRLCPRLTPTSCATSTRCLTSPCLVPCM